MFSPAVQSLLCLLLLVVSATVVVQAAPTSISTTSASSTSTPISTPTSTISPLLIKNSITYCLHIIKGELQHQITDESGLVSYCVLKGGETKILAHVLYQSNRFAECEVSCKGILVM